MSEKNEIQIDERKLVDTVTDWIKNDADLDDLGRVAGEIAGGECFYDTSE